MPDPSGVISVGLDFDGSLVEQDEGGTIRWRRGAREFIVGAAEAGLRLWVHSCRCTVVGYEEMPGDAEEFYRSGRVPDDVEYSWGLREELEAFLVAEGVRPLVQLWEGPGKPICDVYADDRAERPDWLVLAAELGVRLAHAEPRGAASLGQPAGVVLQPAPVAAGPGAVPGPGPAPAAAAGVLLGP